jgi:hypothetical protein
MPIMDTASPMDGWTSAKTHEDVLRLLRPHLRAVLEQADPVMLEAFDASYDDATTDAVEEILHGPAVTDEISGEQNLGLRGHITMNLISFLINVAATVSVVRFEADHPCAWYSLTDMPSAATACAEDPLDRWLVRSGLSSADRARAEKEIRKNPKLLQIIRKSNVP